MTSILVPTDFSPESEVALAYAAGFAKQFEAKLTVLHVVEPIASPGFANSLPLAVEDDRQIADCRVCMERMLKDNGIDAQSVEKILVRYGRAFNEIADAARTLKVDLVIVSTHGYTGFKRALLGSTTERIVRYAPCPVLVVRLHEPHFESINLKPKTQRRS